MQKNCIIIPCYNESKRFPINDFVSYYQKNIDIHYCFVNDGSKDNTIGLLKELQKNREERILVVDLPKNVGKGEAIRNGLIKAIEWKQFEYLGFFDADLATPLTEFDNLLSACNNEHQLIMGSRIKKMGSKIERSGMRHYLGRIFATVVGCLLKIPVYDTQCGAKIFKLSLAQKICDTPFISRWLFDIEILKRVLLIYGKEKTEELIIEVPLNEWEDKSKSRLKLKDFISAPFELFKIQRKYGNISK